MRVIHLVIPATVLSILFGCGSSSEGIGGITTVVPSSVQSTQGGAYTLSVFAEAPGKLRPDDLLQMGNTFFVVYQDNNINPDGTLAAGVTSAQSEVIEYDLNGNVLQTFNVPGHPDGLVAFNATTVWVSSNEDANPLIITIDTSTNTTKTLKSDVAALPHGGGLDDMKLIGGVVYASASNPTLTTTPVPNLAPYSTDASGSTAVNGVSTEPAIYAISMNSDGSTFHATPVLISSTPATLLPGNTAVTLNMTDPDSSAIDPNGDLVTVSQQDSEIVYIHNLDTTSPSVSVLPLTLNGSPSQIDDVRWSPASGNSYMLLSDNKAQLVYRIDATSGFEPNTAYGAGQGMLLQIDTTSGVMTPIYVGMNAPHGLIFVPE
jgi:hypothetical protein